MDDTEVVHPSKPEQAPGSWNQGNKPNNTNCHKAISLLRLPMFSGQQRQAKPKREKHSHPIEIRQKSRGWREIARVC
jgi:hypothetical protein